MRRSFSFLHSATVFLFIAMFSNLLLLNMWVWKFALNQDTGKLNSIVSPISTQDTTANSIVQETPTPTSALTPTSAPLMIAQSSSVKEFYIPLGTGKNATDDWADVNGLQAYIDTTNYGNIRKVTFEVGVHIPTGNEIAYARLFNVTDKHPVWFSEVSLEGGDPKFLVSQPIALETGNKLYQVQMKTSLKFEAVLDQARIHVITY